MGLSLVLLFGSIAAYGWFARAVGIGQPQLLAQVLDHINGWIGWAALVLIGVPLARQPGVASIAVLGCIRIGVAGGVRMMMGVSDWSGRDRFPDGIRCVLDRLEIGHDGSGRGAPVGCFPVLQAAQGDAIGCGKFFL